jgi:hypothetical protein
MTLEKQVHLPSQINASRKGYSDFANNPHHRAFPSIHSIVPTGISPFIWKLSTKALQPQVSSSSGVILSCTTKPRTPCQGLFSHFPHQHIVFVSYRIDPDELFHQNSGDLTVLKKFHQFLYWELLSRAQRCRRTAASSWAYLDKSNVLGLFSEALSADVKTVFADETGLVCANATIKKSMVRIEALIIIPPSSVFQLLGI